MKRTLIRVLFIGLLAHLPISPSDAQETTSEPPAGSKVAEVGPGAVSPHGRFLSYTDWSTGDLAVRDLETGESRRLTQKGSWAVPDFAQAVQAISPDGRYVAYGWQGVGSCDLRIVRLGGGEPRVLYRDEDIQLIEPQDWSPDGRHILVTALRRDRTSQTLLVSVEDGSVQVLVTRIRPQNMAFSPDGRFIVYDVQPVEDSLQRDIHLPHVDGTPGVALVEHSANDTVLGWSPDGSRVLFVTDRAGTSDVWAIQVVNGRGRGVADLVRPDIGAISASWLGLTRDGSYYFGRDSWVNDVYVTTLDPVTGAADEPQRLVSHVLFDTSVEWSPDGQELAYATDGGDVVLGVWTISTGAERRLPLEMTQVHAFQPHWAPDGGSLLAQGRNLQLGGLAQGFYRIDVQTGDLRPLLVNEAGQTAGTAEWPVWSSDAKTMFYRRADPRRRGQSLVVRDVDSGRERELYSRDLPAAGELPTTVVTSPTVQSFRKFGYAGASRLAISPDGQQLAFVWTEQDGAGQGPSSAVLTVIPTANGGEPRELVRVDALERIFPPAWMPDGDLLFGRGRVEGQGPRFELWKASTAGGEPERLGLSMEGSVLYGLSVHPNGRRVAFTAGHFGSLETWVLNNLLPAG